MKRNASGSQWKLLQLLITTILLCGTWACGASATPAPQTQAHDDSPITRGTSSALDTAFTPTTWDARTAPEYYREVGTAQIDWDLPAGSVEYSPLDALGRATGAHAHVTSQLMNEGRARTRDDSSELKPTGWGHNAQVDIALANGDSYHGELWNRSHLLAKSLGGAEVLENLVTGTRMQNVGSNRNGGASGGMGYCEGLARDWLDAHPNGTLRYSATPVYLGSELVCRSVVVDLRSSDGTLDKRVEVYNAAAGYEIDYESGTFRAATDAGTTAGTGTADTQPSTTPTAQSPATPTAQSPATPTAQSPATPKAPPVKRGWQQEGGTWQHYDDNGTPSSGWLADNGSWYLLSAGSLLTGWQAVDGLWYYLGSDGRLASDQWIDNTYYVDASGAMLADTRTPDGYLVDAHGAYVPEAPEPEPVVPEPTGQAYVLNHNTHKFHYPSCASAKKIKPKNREDVVLTRDEIIARGFVPCKNCNP